MVFINFWTASTLTSWFFLDVVVVFRMFSSSSFGTQELLECK